MFASKTPRDLNHDPLPYRCDSRTVPGHRVDSQDSPARYRAPYLLDPRPEFDHVQHNPPNRLLRCARYAQADGHLDAFMEGFLAEPNEEHPEVHHAQKVLTRLARLTKETA